MGNSKQADKPILFVHQGFELYGSDKMLLLNVKAASIKYPARKLVVVLPKSGILSELLENEYNVEVLIKNLGVIRKYDLKRYNFAAFFKVFTFFRLLPFINSFDFVYINSIVIIDYILATRFAKTKAFIHIHELPQGYASKIFSKLLSFSGAHLIFISSASKNAFIHLKNAKQSIVWNGVKPLQQSKPIAEALNKIKLLLIGRINSWKGQPLLIEAIALLSDTEKNIIEVQIVGDVFMDQQQLKTELTEQIFKNNLQDKIKISPFTTSPEVFYNWADVVIVPSLLPEPFGLVAIEAMSLGKLVIAAGHGGLKEIITHNVSGMLFKPGDANDLSHKIKEVIQNPSLITVLGENGRRKFETNFTEEIYIKKINELI